MSPSGKLNYGNDEHFAAVLQRFGGEKYLKTHFPRILQLLRDTREWHKTLQNTIGAKSGYTDTCRISLLNMTGMANPSVGVLARSFMSMVEKHPMLIMTGVLEDPKYGKRFGSFAGCEENMAKLENELGVDSRLLAYCKSPIVEAQTSFMATGNVDGKSVVTLDIPNVKQTICIPEGGAIFKDIKVVQPAPKVKEATHIRVVYNGRQDQDAAYNFPAARDRMVGNDRYVLVFYPFSIQVTLNDLFEFNLSKPVSFDYSLNLSMVSEVVTGGEVHFNTAFWNKIKARVEGNILTLDFPYAPQDEANYWGVEMPLTAKQAEGYFDFHLNFTANFRAKGSGSEYMPATVVISSEALPPSQNFRKIQQSRILWGCLGKDTLILTENGQKPISELKIGDKLFTDRGYVALKNMVTGTEEKIIAVGYGNDRILRITKQHPIATDRGVIPAFELMAGDKLRLENGSFQSLNYLEVLDYNDKVYSPELEQSALISADGIMVGDYLTPVTNTMESAKDPEPLPPDLRDELKRWSELKHEQLQKENNV